jgi:hypothetical protein
MTAAANGYFPSAFLMRGERTPDRTCLFRRARIRPAITGAKVAATKPAGAARVGRHRTAVALSATVNRLTLLARVLRGSALGAPRRVLCSVPEPK